MHWAGDQEIGSFDERVYLLDHMVEIKLVCKACADGLDMSKTIRQNAAILRGRKERASPDEKDCGEDGGENCGSARNRECARGA